MTYDHGYRAFPHVPAHLDQTFLSTKEIICLFRATGRKTGGQ